MEQLDASVRWLDLECWRSLLSMLCSRGDTDRIFRGDKRSRSKPPSAWISGCARSHSHAVTEPGIPVPIQEQDPYRPGKRSIRAQSVCRVESRSRRFLRSCIFSVEYRAI